MKPQDKDVRQDDLAQGCEDGGRLEWQRPELFRLRAGDATNAAGAFVDGNLIS